MMRHTTLLVITLILYTTCVQISRSQVQLLRGAETKISTCETLKGCGSCTQAAECGTSRSMSLDTTISRHTKQKIIRISYRISLQVGARRTMRREDFVWPGPNSVLRATETNPMMWKRERCTNTDVSNGNLHNVRYLCPVRPINRAEDVLPIHFADGVQPPRVARRVPGRVRSRD